MKVYIVNHLFIDMEEPDNCVNMVWGVFSTIEQAREHLANKIRKECEEAFSPDEIEIFIKMTKVNDDLYLFDDAPNKCLNKAHIEEHELF